VIGDAIGLILGLELIKVASKADLPKHIYLQMLSNVIFDFVVRNRFLILRMRLIRGLFMIQIGLAPVVGDLLDAVIKCNWRNAMLLEDYLMLRRRDEIRAEKGLVNHHNDGLLSPEPTATGGKSKPPHHMALPEASSSSQPPPAEQNKKYGSLLPRF
jgi:hypothetical protein